MSAGSTLGRLLTPWVLALLVHGAASAEPQAAALAAPMRDLGTLPVSAAPPLSLAAALESLPPGVRPPAERVGLAWFRGDPAGPYHARLVERIDTAPAPGKPPVALEVEYTIDPELDEAVRDVLARGHVRLGHVILMDPGSGEVFSYVSTDPETFPATRTYPTASLMKVVTAAAVLRNAPEAAARECRYAGSPYQVKAAQLRPPRRGGSVESLLDAIAISNNQCFARLAVHDLGPGTMIDELLQAGLLDAPGVRHPPGRVEPIHGALELGHLGSGLAGSYVTPLGAARLAAALAQGDLVQPYWIARIRAGDGRLLALPERRRPRPIWGTQVADELRQWMVGVTTHGTAKRAFQDDRGESRLGPVQVAGKTGTLKGTNPDGLYQWFIGVAPAEAPRIAIAVVVVHETRATSGASEVASATLREIFCGAADCETSRVERLHARARARDAESAAQAVAKREERAQARAALDSSSPARPAVVSRLDFPPRLRQKKVDGEIVLLVSLTAQGEVEDVRVDSSDLPDFDEFVSSEVRSWRFAPAVRDGRAVQTTVRLPIPIHIQ